MRGRVKAVLVGFILLSSNLAADCTWTPRQSAQFRTTALDLSVDGNFVWLATGYGVQLLEGTDIVASVALPGSTRVVVADGHGSAWAGSGSRVYVLRRDGSRVTVTGSADAGGAVNDAVLAFGDLFVATANGIAHFELAGGITPVRSSIVASTSSPNVTSLAVAGSTLYAADGDGTVEMFTFTSPAVLQKIGELAGLPRASVVHAGEDGFVYVSDRFSQTTEVFSGTTRAGTIPFPALSFAGGAGRVHYIAGRDLTVRAVDFSAAQVPLERFEAKFAGTDGTDNVIHDLERSGNTLYVAAGDAGFAAIDVGAISQPYPLVSYGSGATTSVVTEGTKAWFADASGKVSEQDVDAGGVALTETRNWNAGAGARLRDVRDNGLLATSGAVATVWALVSATPVPAFSATFPEVIASAILSDAYLVAFLANGSVYTRSAQTEPQKVNVPPVNLLARSGSAIAMTEIREEERKTILHYWPTGDLAAEPRRFTIDGAAVTMALDPTRAAVFTFTGINVVDLAGGAVRVIPGSDVFIPRQLAFAGGDLLALDVRRLFVYANAATLAREQALPANAAGVGISGTVAVLATDEGVAAVSRVTAIPRPLAPFANNYYTKGVADGDRLYLFSRNGIDVFTTAGPLQYIRGLRVPGAVDLAAGSRGLFTVTGNGTIDAFSNVGAPLARRTLEEGVDQQVLSIWSAGDAVWVSLATGCTSGGCVRKTLVLDPDTLAVTATLPGTVRDLAVSGTRAYALFDHPDEIRVYDLAVALQPAQIAAAARPPSATSIAYESGRVHVLGDRLYTYAEASLALTAQRLTAVAPDESQRIRIQSGCAVITGRSGDPELYSISSWTPATGIELPSTVRSIALQNGRAIFLTAHSVEIWTTLPTPPAPARRRSVR